MRADSRVIRQKVAESFAEKMAGQELSAEPLDARDYDLSRFFTGFDLDSPEMEDAAIKQAAVIKAEVSMVSLKDRLSLTSTLDEDLDGLIARRRGLREAFSTAVAVRFIEIAVRYVPRGETEERTLDFTISDSNSCSLQSLPDERDRVIGHRLLRHWGILSEFREPEKAEECQLLPVILELWNMSTSEISGAWLQERDVDAEVLTDAGFLQGKGWDDTDLIEEHGVGIVAADVIAMGSWGQLQPVKGQEFSVGSPKRYRRYHVDSGWVIQWLSGVFASELDDLHVEKLSADLFSLGFTDQSGSRVPIYLARQLTDEQRISEALQHLDNQRHRDPALVLSAGPSLLPRLGRNVIVSLLDHLDASSQEHPVPTDRIFAEYWRSIRNATQRASVRLDVHGNSWAELIMPDKEPLQVFGTVRIAVIQGLVDAYDRQAGPVKFAQLRKGYDSGSMQDVFKKEWPRIRSTYLRSPRKGFWELAVDDIEETA